VDLGLEGPAGEGAGRFTDILFRVGADAHAEQLEKLATQFSLTAVPWFWLLSSQKIIVGFLAIVRSRSR